MMMMMMIKKHNKRDVLVFNLQERKKKTKSHTNINFLLHFIEYPVNIKPIFVYQKTPFLFLIIKQKDL